MKNRDERIIGRFEGSGDGPMLICIGGIHGNEPAGVAAVALLFELLRVEPLTNPDFTFRGTLLGLRGNLQALEEGKRYIAKDLNRSMTREHVDSLFRGDPTHLRDEDLELYELVGTIRDEIDTYRPEKVIVLDLHTTTAKGGIFVLTSNIPESIRLGQLMEAPVITGFADDLRGTTMEYFQGENFNVDMTPVVFEGGQHEDPLSVNRILAAIINMIGNLGMVNPEHIDNRHNYLLQEYSAGLPRVAKLLYRHAVTDETHFTMLPDFTNFHQVNEGDVLAYEDSRPVLAPKSGMLLMPKYQPQGQDGFFIIEPLTDY